MGLSAREKATLNAIFMGVFQGDECENDTERAALLLDIVTDRKATFNYKSLSIATGIPEIETVRHINGLIDHGFVARSGKASFRITDVGAHAIADDRHLTEFMEIATLPLAA